MTVITRFAPSPTGDLHIGGARTALFAWLFARANSGKFLLRIEDTDRARSTEEAVETILDGLDWLGLCPDEPPTFQSQRADRHVEVANELIERGHAFKCYLSPEELDRRRQDLETAREELRSLAAAEGGSESDDPAVSERVGILKARVAELSKAFRSPYRDGSVAPPADGAPYVVRLRIPDDMLVTVDDAVQGKVSIGGDELDDMILLRSDGTPTYMLAVVVDDHDMGVTHVIRGDDHFRNTFRQIPIMAAMEWPVPIYAHIPLIHGSDGKKLSKRHGAQSVTAFRDLGFLPEGVKNYLLRLGWSHGDDEIISEEQAIEWFGLGGLNKAPARLDLQKLASVNGHYMARADDERLGALLLQRSEFSDLGPEIRARVLGAVGSLKSRAADLAVLSEAVQFLLDIRPIELTGKRAKLLNDENLKHLKLLSNQLSQVQDWGEPTLKNAIDRYCEDQGVGIGKVGPVLRAVLTGGAPSPDLATVLALLGREESLARVSDFAG